MKSFKGPFYICGVKYPKMLDNGKTKAVSENYVVSALSFTEAEANIIQNISPYANDLSVESIKKATFSEIFIPENEAYDKWYIAKLDFLVIDEKSDKEKKQKVCYLVNAANLGNAIMNVDKAMRGTMIDYRNVAVTESDILDVFNNG